MSPAGATDQERSRLDDRRRRAQEIVSAALGPEAKLDRSLADLALLQQVLDGFHIRSDEVEDQECLGVALGDVLAHALGLSWVIVEDQHGRDPALRWKETTLILFPESMISKRIERGEAVNVLHLVEQAREHIKRLRGRVE
jgi:hypothetical protein